MKTLFAFTLTTLIAISTQAATLTLRFKVKSVEGQILWAVYKPNEKFPASNAASYGGKTPVGGLEVITRIENVPFGYYAVASSHDQNGNGKMDYNIIGIPKEPFGFSNGAKASITGAPSFDEAKISFSDESQIFDVVLEKF